MRSWLAENDNHTKVDRIVFVVFLPEEVSTYQATMPYFFPLPTEAPAAEAPAEVPPAAEAPAAEVPPAEAPAAEAPAAEAPASDAPAV